MSAPEHSDAVVLERTVPASIEEVWAAWTSGERFAEWYGPMGARIPVAELDLVVGGRRRVCMEMDTPNGAMQMWFVGEFVEIDEPGRLVYTEAMGDEDGNVKTAADMGMPEDTVMTTVVVVDLAAVDGGTSLRLEHRGVPADSPGAQGWAMALDKLVERLG